MLANPADNRVVAIDCETLELQVLLVDARYYRGACALQSDGDTIWLFPYTGTNVVQWNPMTGETVTHNCRVPGFVCNQYPTGKTCMERAFGSMARRENQVVLAPVSGNQFVFIDTETGEVNHSYGVRSCIPGRSELLHVWRNVDLCVGLTKHMHYSIMNL